MTSPELSVIVFAFDEEENVRPVLEELIAFLDDRGPESQIVFVDDGSRDATSTAATEALEGRDAVVLRHGTNRGIGAALKTGVAAARAPWVTFLPCDGQVPPQAVEQLFLARAGVELVLSVYENRDDGPYRKLLSLGVRTLIFAVHGVRVRSDGPYLFRRPLLDPEQLSPDSFFLNFELPIRARRGAIATRTIPIPCRPRRAGHSKSAGLRRIVGVGADLLMLRARRRREALERLTGRPLGSPRPRRP